jgi:hypothetical protein
MEDGMLRMTSYSEDQKEEDGMESQSSIGTEMELLTGKILQPWDGEHQLGDQEEEKLLEPTGTEMALLMPEMDGEDSENGTEEPGIHHGEEMDGEQTLSQLEKFQLELNGKIQIGEALKDGIHQFGLNQLGLLQLGLNQLGLLQLGDGMLQLGDQEEEKLLELTGTEMALLMPEMDGEDSENGPEEPGIHHGEEMDGEQTLSQLEKFQLELNGEILIGEALKDGIHQFGLNQLGLLQLGMNQLGLLQLGDGMLQLGDGKLQLEDGKNQLELEKFQLDGQVLQQLQQSQSRQKRKLIQLRSKIN